MEYIPIKALKIVSEINQFFEEATDSNEYVCNAKFNNILKEYTPEMKQQLNKYDVEKLVVELNKLKLKSEIAKYFRNNISIKDRNIVYTEMLKQGLQVLLPQSMQISPLSIYQHTMACRYCKEKQQEPVFFPTKRDGDYYGLFQCEKCHHSNIEPVCNCKYCAVKWEKVTKKIIEFDEFFDKGITINIIGKKGYDYTCDDKFLLDISITKEVKHYLKLSISSVKDFHDFLDFFNNQNIEPYIKFSIDGI